MADEEGWSAPVSRGGKPRTVQPTRILLRPTVNNGHTRELRQGLTRGTNDKSGNPSLAAAPTHAGRSSVSTSGAKNPSSETNGLKFAEFSIGGTSSDAFPALGTGMTKLKAKTRLQDVRSKQRVITVGSGVTGAEDPASYTHLAKRAKKITLFDMILKGSQDSARPVVRSALPKTPLKAAVAAVSAKHVARKKKKRASHLKKKLLKERILYRDSLVSRLPDATTEIPGSCIPAVTAAGANEGSELIRTVAIRHFIDDSIEDDEELEEVLDSARELMLTFGELLSVIVKDNPCGGSGKVLLVSFTDAVDAARACIAIHGSVYGGVAVEASLVASPIAEQVSLSTPNYSSSLNVMDQSNQKLVVKTQVLSGLDNDRRLNYENHSIIFIRNFVFPNDIEDEDEAHDVLNDTRLLCEKFSPNALWIESPHAADQTALTTQLCASGSGHSSPIGILSFRSLAAAAMCRDRVCMNSSLSAFVVNEGAAEDGCWSLRTLFGASVNNHNVLDRNYDNSALECLTMSTNFCIKIGKFVSTEDIADDDERGDIVSEIRELCKRKIDELKETTKSCNSEYKVDCVMFGQSPTDESDNEANVLDVYVFVNARDGSLTDALTLGNALDEVYVGGAMLDVSLCCIHSSTLEGLIPLNSSSELLDPADTVWELDGCLAGFECKGSQLLQLPRAGGSYSVVVFGLPWRLHNSYSGAETSQLMDSYLLEHPLWRYEWKLSLLQVCGYPDVASLMNFVLDIDIKDRYEQVSLDEQLPSYFEFLKSVYIADVADAVNENNIILRSAPKPSLDVCVAFSSLKDAIAAQLYLDSLIIGGAELRVSSKLKILSENQKIKVKSDIVALEALASSGLSAAAPVFTPQNRRISATGSKGSEACVLKESADITPKPKALGGPTKPPPRLPRRTSLNVDIPLAINEINDVIKVFLSSLAAFQKRVKDTDPVNFNRKRRLMFGMKQVKNAVKSGRAKIIFIAPDFEDSEALDEKLDELIEEAKGRETPMICCLSRRQLAKAVGTSMRQLVVAVLDADGAFDSYKLILEFIREFA